MKGCPTSRSDGGAFAGDFVRHGFSGRKFEELVHGTMALVGAAGGDGSGDVRQKAALGSAPGRGAGCGYKIIFPKADYFSGNA